MSRARTAPSRDPIAVPRDAYPQNGHLLFWRVRAIGGIALRFQRKTDLDCKLIVPDLAFFNVPSSLQDLKPIHVANGPTCLRDGTIDRVFNTRLGRTDYLDHFVNMVFIVGPLTGLNPTVSFIFRGRRDRLRLALSRRPSTAPAHRYCLWNARVAPALAWKGDCDASFISG
jgi:hypothetical protein